MTDIPRTYNTQSVQRVELPSLHTINPGEEFIIRNMGNCMTLVSPNKAEKIILKPEPTHFTIIEGGEWYIWEARHTFKWSDRNFHAIKFEDGSIFDMINGWRP